MIIEWRDEYKLGIRLIDTDHKGLFDAINSLHSLLEQGSSVGDIASELNFFSRYARDHFDREEALMREYQYPEISHHILKHRSIRKSVFAIRKIYAEKPHLIDTEKLIDFFATWLKHHILKEDMAYRPFVVEKAAEQEIGSQDKSDNSRLGQQGVDKKKKTPIVKIDVSVPENSKQIMERCAAILCAGGVDAEDLKTFVDPMFNMTLDEVKTFAKIVLIDDEN